MEIEFIGFKTLDEQHQSILNQISTKSVKRIKSKFPESKLIIIIKKYEKEGKGAKYSLNAKLENPRIKFAARSHDWDLAKAAHKIFYKLENEIHHKLKDNE